MIVRLSRIPPVSKAIIALLFFMRVVDNNPEIATTNSFIAKRSPLILDSYFLGTSSLNIYNLFRFDIINLYIRREYDGDI